MSKTRPPQPNEPRWILLIEDAPDVLAHDANTNKQGGTIRAPRTLEYAMIVRRNRNGAQLLIDGVRDAKTLVPITDDSTLPNPQVVMDAACLYDWHQSNQAIFTDGKVIPSDITPCPIVRVADEPDSQIEEQEIQNPFTDD